MKRCLLSILVCVCLGVRAAVPTFESFNPTQFDTNNNRIGYIAVHTNDVGIIYPALPNVLSIVTNLNSYGTFSLPAKVTLLTPGTNYLDLSTNTTWLLNSPTNDATQVILSLSAGAYQGQLAFITSQNGGNSFTLPDLSEQWDVPGAFVDIQGDWIGTTNRGVILQYTSPDWIEMARFDPAQLGGGTALGSGTAGTIPIWTGPTTLSNSLISKITSYMRFAQPSGVNDTLRIADNALFPNDGTQFLDGTGHWGTPTAGSVTATNAYDLIEDEGAPLTLRNTINFVGLGVTAADGGTETVVTIPSWINPGDGYIPYRFDANTFLNSPIRRLVGAAINIEGAVSMTPRDVSGVNVDASLGNEFSKTLSGNASLGIISMADGQRIHLVVTNTTFTLAFTNAVGTGLNQLTWLSGVVPVLDTNAVNVFTFFRSGGRIFAPAPEQLNGLANLGSTTIGTGVVVKTNATDFTTFDPLPIRYGGTGTNSLGTTAGVVPFLAAGSARLLSDSNLTYDQASSLLNIARSPATGAAMLAVDDGATGTELHGYGVRGTADLRLDAQTNITMTIQAALGLKVNDGLNVLIGDGTTTTSRTNIFLYVPTTAVKPTGSAHLETGYSPLVFDAGHRRLYIYEGGIWNLIGGGTGSNGPVDNLTVGRIPYADNTNTLADGPLLRGNAYTVTLSSTNNNTPSYEISPANTNTTTGFFAVNQSDSDGSSAVAWMNGFKGTGWDVGTPTLRNGGWSVNVLNHGVMDQRLEIDGAGPLIVLQTNGSTTAFSIAANALYPNDATKYFDGTGHYSTPTGTSGLSTPVSIANGGTGTNSLGATPGMIPFLATGNLQLKTDSNLIYDDSASLLNVVRSPGTGAAMLAVADGALGSIELHGYGVRSTGDLRLDTQTNVTITVAATPVVSFNSDGGLLVGQGIATKNTAYSFRSSHLQSLGESQFNRLYLEDSTSANYTNFATFDVSALADSGTPSSSMDLLMDTGTGTKAAEFEVALNSAVSSSGATFVQMKIDTHTVFKFDGDSTAGNTRFLLWDVDSGTLKRVSVGTNDSAGVGFKVLRIAN